MANLNQDALETMPCRYGRMTFFRNDNILSWSLREYGEWAQAEIDFLLYFIGSRDTVLDIGAFIGTHTLAFAQKVSGGGTVYAFEPQPVFFEVLKRNIKQNAVKNVKALRAAVSEKTGRTKIGEIDLYDIHNFGGDPALAVGSTPSNSGSRHTTAVMTVDQLALKRCDFIKIDVENMEINVLKGAQQTLRAMRPVVFAECNSLEYGWPVVEFSREEDYGTYLLNVRAYNPHNFRRNADNFFGDASEAGLVLIPKEQHRAIQDHFDSVRYPSLIPICSIDDLALALLKKPQYKYEVLSKGKAATVLGIEFLPNEPEVRQLQGTVASLQKAATERDQQAARLSEDNRLLQVQVTDAEQTLRRLTEQVQALQAQATGREARIAALETTLAEREQQTARLSEDNRQLQGQVAETEQTLRQLTEQVQALQAQATGREARNAALETTLAEREQQTARLSEEVGRLGTQLANLRQQAAEQEARIAALETTLAERDQAAQQLSQQVETLRSQLREKEGLLREQQEKLTELRRQLEQEQRAAQEAQNQAEARAAVLNQIYHSHGWRALSVYYRLREKLLPEGSRRKRVARFFLWQRNSSGPSPQHKTPQDLTNVRQRRADKENDLGRRDLGSQAITLQLSLYVREAIRLLRHTGWRKFVLNFPRYFTEGRGLLRDMRLVAASGLFDSDWYLQRNPDVAKAGVNPLRHYLRRGAIEGRDPNPFFDSDWYLQQNPDVAKAGVNPLAHYLRRGAKERRDPSPYFDSDWYLQQNPDVAKAGVNPLAHYLQQGAKEGRSPSANLDGDRQLQQNPDVGEADANPQAHHPRSGATEGVRKAQNDGNGRTMAIPFPVRTARFLKINKEKKALHIGIGLVEHFGDIVACEPVVRYLKRQSPDAEISWVVREPYRELLDSNPYIDRTIAVECLTDWIKLVAHGAFDRVVDLHVNERICQRCKLPLSKTSGDVSVTGDTYFNYGSVLRSFCVGAGLPPLEEQPRVYISEEVVKTVDALGLPDSFVVFHCRSNETYKDWDPVKWNALAEHVVKAFRTPVVEVGLEPVLSPHISNGINLCGKTSLLETAEIIKRAALFVGVDSGPAHLANAVDTYGIVLIGRIGPFERYNPFTGRYADGSNAILIRNENGPATDIPFDIVKQAIVRKLDSGQKDDGNAATADKISSGVKIASRESPEALSSSAENSLDKELPRLIAFYLPQYYPIPENDVNWGKGFTEWRNVGKSRPFFEGQYQPRLPGELGYYDLRVPEIMERQAALAQEHGIHGFCYYLYWFQGKQLLHLPVDTMLRRRKPNQPFCLCWANENWTRRWDGMEREILVAQKHTHEDDIKFVRRFLPAFDDPRYIRVNGRPLLLIYRTELFPNPLRTVETWRSELRKAGLGDPYLVRCEGFDPWTKPEEIGFDASYEVPTFILPEELLYDKVKELKVSPEFAGRIYDYEKIVRYYSEREDVAYKRFKGIMLAWDNTPRHGKNAVVFHNVTPGKYSEWLRNALLHTLRKFRGEERLVFINAWNEWAEGNYLEPDLRYGRSFLEATKSAYALMNRFDSCSPRISPPFTTQIPTSSVVESPQVTLQDKRTPDAACPAWIADGRIAMFPDLSRRLGEFEAGTAKARAGTESDLDAVVNRSVERALSVIRAEYTTLPRFAYHLPLDYEIQTLPPRFDPPVWVDGEILPLPPPAERHGHAADDAEYLEWGRYDHDIILGHIRRALPSVDKLAVMDFGCSSGRVLRHFFAEMREHGWTLTAVDVSARHVEWMRRNFPPEFQVYTGTVLPILPFESNTFDVIYGISVFTHMKFLWDMWLLELRRVLKPGGMLIHTIHTENAWNFFVQHRHEDWARKALGPMIIDQKKLPDDFVYFGNIGENQVFWKKDIAVAFWGRYFKDVTVFPPPEKYSYQDWLVGRKAQCGELSDHHPLDEASADLVRVGANVAQIEHNVTSDDPATPGVVANEAIRTFSVDQDFSQHGEQRIILDFFSHCSRRFNKYCVDAGAYDGIVGSNSRALFLNGWRGVVIEPNPRTFARLRALYADRPDITCVQIALSDRRQENVTMKFATGPTGTAEEDKWKYAQVSTLHDAFSASYEKDFEYVYETSTISTDTLTNVLRQAQAAKDIGFLCIDCEGEDLKIVRGLDLENYRPLLICVEADENNRHLFAEIIEPHGYALHAYTVANAFFRLKD